MFSNKLKLLEIVSEMYVVFIYHRDIFISLPTSRLLPVEKTGIVLK